MIARLFLACAAALFVASVCRALAYERIGFTEDMSLSMAVADAALHETPVLLGPPSHTGGRHLGPIGYWHVMFAKAVGRDTYGASAIIGLIEALSLLALAMLVARIVPERMKTWAVGAALLCASATHYPDVLSYPWLNHFILPVSAIFVAAIWYAWRGGRAGVALAALSGAELIQLHYTSLPFVAVLASALVLRRLFQRGALFELGDPQALLIWAVAIFAWAPLVVFQLKFPDALARTFGPHTSGALVHSGFRSAAEVELGFFKLYALGSSLFPMEWGPELRTIASWALLAASALWLGLFLFRADGATRSFFAALFSACAGYVAALAWVPPPLFSSYLFALFPLPVIFVGVAMGTAFDVLAQRGALLARGAAALTLAAWLGISAGQAYRLVQRQEYTPIWNSLRHAEQVAAVLTRDRAGERLELLPPQAASAPMRGVFLYLLGRGYYPEIQYWDWLTEFPKQESPRATVGYLVSCPALRYRDLDAFDERERAEGWLPERNVNTAQCSTCARCLIRRYRRGV